MRRQAASLPQAAPVDAHERTRDARSAEALAVLLQGPPRARSRWRQAALRRRTFYHGLRVTARCRLKRQDVDRTHGRRWMQRLTGRLSTEHPLHADARRTRKRSVTQRGKAHLPWLLLHERRAQLTRAAMHDLGGIPGVRAGLTFHVQPPLLRHGCGYALATRGYALRVMQDSLGHRDPKPTTRDPRPAAHRFAGLGA